MWSRPTNTSQLCVYYIWVINLKFILGQRFTDTVHNTYMIRSQKGLYFITQIILLANKILSVMYDKLSSPPSLPIF